MNIKELQTTLKTLQALSSSPQALADLDPKQRLALVEAARVVSGRPKRKPRPAPQPLSAEHEAALTSSLASSSASSASSSASKRPCYICFATTVVDRDALCATCRAAEDSVKDRVDGAGKVLAGKVVVVTGGRVNIGHATAIAAARLGARVVVTTRFRDDAVARFRAAGVDNIDVVGLDLHDLNAVERFADAFDHDGVFAIVHNAAQTLPLPLSTLTALTTTALPPATQAALQTLSPSSSNTSLAAPELSVYGTAPDASWRHRVKDVSTRELLEVLLINAAAPFVLTRALLPALRRSPSTPRVVVNVTSSEGRFSFSREDGKDSGARGERRGKSPRHPHLNMAKAALNMMTRTSAVDLWKDSIVLVGVDPGWVSGPLPAGGFHSGRFPLDADEAARRVLHPLIATALGQPPLRGALYKNYRPAPW